jgi:ketosteroid isomerase-like protein
VTATGASAELINSAFDAWNRRDIDALLFLLDPGVRLRSLMTEPERQYYHGHEGVREWLSAVVEVFPNWNPEIQEIMELDNSAVVRFHATATGHGSGVTIDSDYWLAVQLRDGKALFFGFYRTEDDARGALAGGEP